MNAPINHRSSTQIPGSLWFLGKNEHDGSVVENELALVIINLALRGIEPDFGPKNADTFHLNLLQSHYIITRLTSGIRRPRKIRETYLPIAQRHVSEIVWN